ncbi:MAG: hypothetical protein Q8L48_37005 [Archangium sp.]|nr:hypothetical protein [Archangium sp.]
MNQGARLLVMVAGTIFLAWVAARRTQLPRATVPEGVRSSGGFSDGVGYADVYRRPEQGPVMGQLDLVHHGEEFGLPSSPTRAWAQHHLCQADPELLARLSKLDLEDLQTWSTFALACESGAALCALARRASDGGAPLSALERQLFPPVLARCSPADLGPWLDAGWLPLEVRSAWLANFGSTEKVDDEILAELEQPGDGGFRFALLSAIRRAPRDEQAARSLVAAHRRGGPHTRWLEYALGNMLTTASTDYLRELCVTRDAGCPENPRIPTDLVELASALVEGKLEPWSLGSDGGATQIEALATCSLSGKPAADHCFSVLTIFDWETAHGVAQRSPGLDQAPLISRFPHREDFARTLATCGVDAGTEASPHFLSESVGRPTWASGTEALWVAAGSALADVPVQVRAAGTQSESTTVTAWWGGERLEVSLPAGCNPPTGEAVAGLANVVLRESGSSLRVYALANKTLGGVALHVVDQPRMSCLADAGLLQPLPLSLVREEP